MHRVGRATDLRHSWGFFSRSRLLFSATLFLSAGLLFIIQPMVAKILLPVYGGTPSVWTVCMLFFQLLLLLAYGYAWALSRLRGVRLWRILHVFVCLLCISVWPLACVPSVSVGIPELQILSDLISQLGLPLLVIAASAPLLQVAYLRCSDLRENDPYFLYAASNAGSLLALISYPWLVERYSGLSLQLDVWNVMFFVYLGLLFCLLFVPRYAASPMEVVKSSNIAWRMKACWIFLSFVPCSLMLGVTFYMSMDLAPTPMLWVVPLALYLFSFVVTFAKKPILSHAWVVRNVLISVLFLMICFIWGASRLPVIWVIFVNCLGFFMLALLCHGELVERRPNPNQLTTFYFCLSLGGVLAGIFNGLLAPRLFSTAIEYPLALVLALSCVPLKAKTSWVIPMTVFALMLMNVFLPDRGMGGVLPFIACALFMIWPGSSRSLWISAAIFLLFLFSPWFKTTHILSQSRNFYGAKQVFSAAGAHVLMSQSTLHGFQVPKDDNPIDGARAYYGAVYPVVRQLQAIHHPLRAMILGLGTGMMACQFRTQDHLTIVEIDEQIIQMAKNPKLFTYLRDCPPHVTLIKDDGLLAVKHVADASVDLLVMDAFNSDAIPIHLLTLEAVAMYLKKLSADGVILVNITNRHLRVLPVLTGAGRQLDLIVLHKIQPATFRLGQLASEWAILTSNEQMAGHLMSELGWRFVSEDDALVWTNDHSNLMSLLTL